MKKIAVIFAMFSIPLLYPISFFVCFDLTRPAPLLYDGGDYAPDGREIQVGPCPRLWTFLICLPHDCDLIGGSRYSGKEWLFSFYNPLCQNWLQKKNYVSPQQSETLWQVTD